MTKTQLENNYMIALSLLIRLVEEGGLPCLRHEAAEFLGNVQDM